MQYKEDDSQFWEDIYLMDDAGWDLGGITPVFESISNQLNPDKKFDIVLPIINLVPIFCIHRVLILIAYNEYALQISKLDVE